MAAVVDDLATGKGGEGGVGGKMRRQRKNE